MKHDLKYSTLTIKCTTTGDYAIIKQTEHDNFLSEIFDKTDKKITSLTGDNLEHIIVRSRVWIQDHDYIKIGVDET